MLVTYIKKYNNSYAKSMKLPYPFIIYFQNLKNLR